MAEFNDQDDSEIHRDQNPEEESTDTNPELRDDVAAHQEPQVKDSQESSQIVSASPASSSAINEPNKITDSSPSSSRNVESGETDETRSATEEEDHNYDGDHDEESTNINLELRDDVTTQETHVQNSGESRKIVSASPASCSAINEANTITDSSPSSPRNVESSETAGIRSATEEEHRNDGDHDEDEPKSDDTTSSLVTQPPVENVGFGSLVTTLPLQENVGSGSLVTSQPRNYVGFFGSLVAPMPWNTVGIDSLVTTLPRTTVGSGSHVTTLPQNTNQQYPVANQIPNVAPMQPQMFTRGRALVVYDTYVPWRPHYTYPVANQIPNLAPMQPQMFSGGRGLVYHNYAPWAPHYTYPEAIQMPMPYQVYNPPWLRMRPMPYPMANQQYLYQQHPMANQTANQFPRQMMTMRPAQMDSGWHGYEQYTSMGIMPIQEPMMYPYQHPEATNELNLRGLTLGTPILAPGPVLQTQTQQPTQSQGLDAGASNELNQRREFRSDELFTSILPNIGVFYDHLGQLQVVRNLETGEISGAVVPVLNQTGELIEFRGTNAAARLAEGSTEQGRDEQQPRSNGP